MLQLHRSICGYHQQKQPTDTNKQHWKGLSEREWIGGREIVLRLMCFSPWLVNFLSSNSHALAWNLSIRATAQTVNLGTTKDLSVPQICAVECFNQTRLIIFRSFTHSWSWIFQESKVFISTDISVTQISCALSNLLICQDNTVSIKFQSPGYVCVYSLTSIILPSEFVMIPLAVFNWNIYFTRLSWISI